MELGRDRRKRGRRVRQEHQRVDRVCPARIGHGRTAEIAHHEMHRRSRSRLGGGLAGLGDRPVGSVDPEDPCAGLPMDFQRDVADAASEIDELVARGRMECGQKDFEVRVRQVAVRRRVTVGPRPLEEGAPARRVEEEPIGKLEVHPNE